MPDGHYCYFGVVDAQNLQISSDSYCIIYSVFISLYRRMNIKFYTGNEISVYARLNEAKEAIDLNNESISERLMNVYNTLRNIK